MQHRISQVDEVSRTGLCSVCGPIKVINGGPKPNGERRWKCAAIHTMRGPYVRRKAKRVRGSICERCKFVPEDICQLDVHHRDGNRRNNKDENLQTLCANCHRLESKRQYYERLSA